eukprot:2545847-Rhodomonas_salina.1
MRGPRTNAFDLAAKTQKQLISRRPHLAWERLRPEFDTHVRPLLPYNLRRRNQRDSLTDLAQAVRSPRRNVFDFADTAGEARRRVCVGR